MSLFFAMPGNEELAEQLAKLTASATGVIETRHFPDGESYVRVHGELEGQDIFLVCTLADPDYQILPLFFASRAIRAQGAASLILVAPYLAYLRQDTEFKTGEAVSSRIFADLIGREFDALVTVEPHLHRYSSLDEIFALRTKIVQASALIGTWIRNNVSSPIIFGPDSESAQWVRAVARTAGCPWATFRKERRGDRDVRLVPPVVESRDHTPILIDDIISSGETIIEAIKILESQSWPAAYCIAIHALFDGATATRLAALTPSVLTTDTVANPFSHFQVAPLIAEQLAITA